MSWTRRGQKCFGIKQRDRTVSNDADRFLVGGWAKAERNPLSI